MGVETPIPPITIYAAAPDGAPPRRICNLKYIRKHLTIPPYPGGDLKEGTLSHQRFS